MPWLNLLCLIWGLVLEAPQCVACSAPCPGWEITEITEPNKPCQPPWQPQESKWRRECGSTARLWTSPATTGPAWRAKTQNPTQNHVLRAEKVGKTHPTLTICYWWWWETSQCGSLSAKHELWSGLFFNPDTKPGSWFDVLRTRSSQTPFFPPKMPFLQFQAEVFPRCVSPTQGEDSLFLEVSGWSRHKAGGRSSLRVLGGMLKPTFIVSPWFSDHLRKWSSGTVPTGAVGTPGKDRNDLMIEVFSEVQHFLSSFIHFQKRTAEMELNAAFQHLSYSEFWSRQEHIGTSSCGLAIPDAGLTFLFL